jgi:hypothetical protein
MYFNGMCSSHIKIAESLTKKLYKTFIYYIHGFISHLFRNKILSRCVSDHRRGSGLMIGFIGLSDTERNYTVQFTITHTLSVHSHVFTSRCSVAASNGGRPPSSVRCRTVPGLSYHVLTGTAHNLTSTSHSPTNSTQLPVTNFPGYFSARTVQKTPFDYCCATVAVETCLSAKPLLTNTCCKSASSAVVA